MQTLVIILVAFTIAEMMFAMGLRLSFSELTGSFRNNPWLILRAVVVNYLVIPVITLFIIKLFHLPLYAGAGLLILGVSPAAPYGPPFTAIAKGNLPVSTGLMIILAGTSSFMVPLLLHLLLPVISTETHAIRIDPVKLVGTLFIIQLLPLCAGLGFGQWQKRMTSLMLKPAGNLSKIMNGLLVVVIAILQYTVVIRMSPHDLMIILILVFTGAVTGWIFGWPGRKNRISVSVITSMRNMSLSMGIAVASFPGSPPGRTS